VEGSVVKTFWEHKNSIEWDLLISNSKVYRSFVAVCIKQRCKTSLNFT
jgi:hypothetical protein